MRARTIVPATLFGVVVLSLAAMALLHFGSRWKLRQMAVVPNVISVPAGGDPVAGAHLASILGCRGCHGADLGGDACYEEPGKYRITCPNITVARERYTDRDLVILLRHGRKQDGALVDFMPWDMYAHLTERDLAHVIAFVRSTPAVERTLPDSEYSWATRWQMLRGEYPLQNDLADYDTKPLTGVAERGRYLASVSCPECHAPDLRGYEGDTAPNLAIAKAYSFEAFTRLMREGITLTGRESATGLMTLVARSRFSHYTPEELVALKTYLDQRDP
jgi:mono/diheme cytochrome c family protein